MIDFTGTRELSASRRGAIGLFAAIASLTILDNSWGQVPLEVPVKTTSLRHIPLPDASYVVADSTSRIPMLVQGRYVIPPNKADFTGDDRSYQLRLRNDQVSLLREPTRVLGQWAFAVRAGKQTVVLKSLPESTTLQSATFALSDKRAYTLAFPHHFTGMMQNQAHSSVWYRSGGVEVAKVDGTDILFYDSSGDGMYRTQDDAMRVGSGSRLPVFAPISANFATSKAIYHLESLSENGAELKYTSYTGKSGKLGVASAATGVDIQLVLQSKDADQAMVCGANQPAMMAIPGTYEVVLGVVGDSRGEMVAAIVPNSISPVEVVDGKPQAVKIGGALSLDFDVALKDEKLQIDPSRFKLQSKTGEQYVRFQWAQPPEIAVKRGQAVKRIGKMAFG